MASSIVGSIVGTFKVGDGHKVGPPLFRPDKPHLTLKGGHYTVNIVAQLKIVYPPKARMKLAAKGYVIAASSTVKFIPNPHVTLRGKTGLRLVTPGRQVTGKPPMTLKGKHYNLNKSTTIQPHKPKLILKGKQINRIGKAGLVPTIPVAEILTPSAPRDEGSLVPSPAYTGLLVPTVEEFV